MNTSTITGKDLIQMGFKPAPWFGGALNEINSAAMNHEQAKTVCQRHINEIEAAESERKAREIPLRDEPLAFTINISADTDEERANYNSVIETFSELMRTPVLEKGVIMPDACPAGPLGSIPVGGVVAARNAILPGAHSADICCSMTASFLEDSDPRDVMDALASVVHFGPGGRKKEDQVPMPEYLEEAFLGNKFLCGDKMMESARSQVTCSGDGNHFASVTVSKVSGKVAIVTHHGSRNPGAQLYQAGMEIAERTRLEISPQTLPSNAWIIADSDEGQEYWKALQIMREWTKFSHAALHDAAIEKCEAKLSNRMWNEHNFVFEEDDGSKNGKLYWHAKGATPIHIDFLPDTTGYQIVPLNMAEPILIISGTRTERNMGFAPHGAGRNMSRTAHMRKVEGKTKEELFAEETKGLDCRFHSGRIDVSELPSAYKNAKSVVEDMARYELCSLVDKLTPFGSIMSGDWEYDAPWRVKARERASQK